MIDPFTAFAAAQGAVKGIKAAMQLGKDVNGLYKEFSAFFQSADEVHRASAKLRMDHIGKTDAQISDQALQIALQSKQLRDSESELKELLIYSGNGQVWDEMMAERLRMTKERKAAELALQRKKEKDRAAMAEMIMIGMYGIAVIVVAIPVVYGLIYIMVNVTF
jgi:hypothetical protein